jgi:Ca2+-binding EF-hand superfamily protein
LFGLVVCTLSFFLYLNHHLGKSGSDTVQKDVADMCREKAVKMGVISLFGIFDEVLRSSAAASSSSGDEKARLRKVVASFFHRYDVNRNGQIDVTELAVLLKDLKIADDSWTTTKEFLDTFDLDRNGEISLDEFMHVLENGALSTGGSLSFRGSDMAGSPPPTTTYGALPSTQAEEEDEDEEDEVPDDLAHLPVEEQQRRIVWRSVRTMAMGLVC